MEIKCIYKKIKKIKKINTFAYGGKTCSDSSRVVLPGLQTFNSAEHVQMTGWILLYYILYIIWAQSFLKLLLCQMEFHYPVKSYANVILPLKYYEAQNR